MNEPAIQRPKPVISKKAMEREVWHKLVVKIIRWQESTKGMTKITPKEWSTYTRSFLKINANTSKDKNMQKLAEAKKLIEDHDGFEE